MLAVVIGASRNALGRNCGANCSPTQGRIDFSWLGDKGFEQMKAKSRDCRRTQPFFLLLVVDGAGVPHPFDHGLKELHAVANAPIFGSDSSQVEREWWVGD